MTPEVEAIEQSSYPDEDDAKERAKAVDGIKAKIAEITQMIQQKAAQARQMGAPMPQPGMAQ